MDGEQKRCTSGGPPEPEQQSPECASGESSQDRDAHLTRREFVITAGTLTAAMALGFPNTADGQALQVKGGLAAGGNGKYAVALEINGAQHEFSLDPRVTLLDLLRENLGLTGTKKGCDHGQCGACTVLVNGRRINSCLSLAIVHDGEKITTVEGLSKGEQLHPVQAALLEHDGLQCGYCTPGQACSIVALLSEARNGAASYVTKDLTKSGPAELTTEEIRERMSGNICRCGAYPRIVEAVKTVHRSSNAGVAVWPERA